MPNPDAPLELVEDNSCGMIRAPSGAHYMVEAEAMYHEATHLCGCGHRGSVHQLLIKCLQATRPNGEGFESLDFHQIRDVLMNDIDVTVELVLHFLDLCHLTEHGSSVLASWVTPLGEQFVAVGPVED